MKSGQDETFVSAHPQALAAQVAAVLAAANKPAFDPKMVRWLAYRPLDRRWFYNDPTLLNRPGPQLQAVWGLDNCCLYALPAGTLRGPAVWCHGLLPDYHAFRGSYGGYAFPLHDRRPEVAQSNLRPELLQGLAAAYGEPVAPTEVFDAILALLSARSYTRRFAEDLEAVFPHVPFPASLDLFRRAAVLGAHIRTVQTFDITTPLPRLADPGFVVLVSTPSQRARLAAPAPVDDGLVLGDDGSGRVQGLPRELWRFQVSGYPVLRRWLEGRIGAPVDLAFFDEWRDVCARIDALDRAFAAADALLIETLQASLSREALGLAT